MGMAQQQEVQSAFAPKHLQNGLERNDYPIVPRNTQPKTSLKPSMSRYRRARKNIPEKPDLTLSIPKAPHFILAEEATSTPSVEDRIERAKIIADTQRRLEGNWWEDQKPSAGDTSSADWWEDKRIATRDRDDSHNPFRDPPVASKTAQDQLALVGLQNQIRSEHAAPVGLDGRLPESSAHTATTQAPLPAINGNRSPHPQIEDVTNDQQPSRYRNRLHNRNTAKRALSQKRRGRSSSEEGIVTPTEGEDMVPGNLSSSKGNGRGKVYNLVTLGRMKTLRGDSKESANSQTARTRSKSTRHEALSRRPTTAERPTSGHRHGDPRTYAPISAANAGNRQVLITYKDAFAQLPVTPSTRARDALGAASGLLNEPIDLRNSIILETWPHLGLERPLRMYERLRAVMNSWDGDSQNGLSIISHPSENAMAEAEKKGAQGGLEIIDAPRKQPGCVTFQLYHSNQSEKWHKRYVTLRPDGQVLLSKKEQSKDTTTVCHMSDFDIYCLRRRQTSKVKPTKNYCYAIKSQQRLSMFLSTDDYVHYFSTNDAKVANEFYDAIDSWRRWYLVYHMADKPQSSGSSGASQPTTPSDVPSPLASPHVARTRREPAIAHQLGSLKPLITMKSMDLEPEPTSDIDKRLSDSSKLVSRAKTVHKAAPSRYKKTAAVYDDITGAFVNDRSRATTAGSASSGLPDEPFMSKGLLGKQYEERQKEMRAREAAMANNVNFPDRPAGFSEMSSSRIGRSITQRERGRNRNQSDNGSNSRAQSRARSAARPANHPQIPDASIQAVPRPLVNFSNEADVPSVLSRRGNAENPLPHDFISRSKTIGSRSHFQGSTARHRSNTTTRSPTKSTNPFFSPQDLNMKMNPFDGRVPTLPASWRDGAQKGPRNGPLVDLSETSQFAEGSLLHRYEALSTPQGPVIDRSVEGTTILVKTGEGF